MCLPLRNKFLQPHGLHDVNINECDPFSEFYCVKVAYRSEVAHKNVQNEHDKDGLSS